MLLQFKTMIVSLFMAMSVGATEPAAINIDNVDNLKEISCLAQAVHGESANQPLKGKLAVAYVIVNRAKDEEFPSDVCKVVNQKGQFHFLKSVKRIDDKNPAVKAQMEEGIKAAWLAFHGLAPDPTNGALYFMNPKKTKGAIWRTKYKRVASIFGHDFFIRKS